MLERKFKFQPTFKRPNDVLIRGKKICGVLVETQGRANGDLESLVIGIGLNVNSTPEELVPGATSVREETGRTHYRRALLKDLLRRLQSDLRGRV